MALPDYTRGSGFYDPARTYKGFQGPPLQADPAYFQAYGTEDNPQGVFQARLAKIGLGGLGSRSQAAQGLYGQAQAGFRAAQAGSNVNLFFPEYLDQVELQRIFKNMSYEQQGLNAPRFQGRDRWGLRGS